MSDFDWQSFIKTNKITTTDPIDKIISACDTKGLPTILKELSTNEKELKKNFFTKRIKIGLFKQSSIY